ncbi:Nramp family divalent metal transporter [Candidatus Sumerlaeota bacterium]|nr:Nramp family divalent metal transporter [Candidatus Sumerlaeota bacterium]
MNSKIEPLKTEDLPQRTKPFWQMTGPGAVLVGLSIGAGELIVWPRLTAQHGAIFVWAAVLGVFLQLWINFEIGRWTIATGESIYTGFSRIWGGYAQAFIFFNVAGWLLPGWARTSGLALKAFIFGPQNQSPDWIWTGLTFAAVALLLFGPKQVYAAVEKVISAMVVIIVLGLIFIAFKVGTWAYFKDLLHGMVNFGSIFDVAAGKYPGLSVKQLFISIVFAGAGGTANLFYAFYLRDKHIGMGARVPALLNPFRQREEKVAQTGFTFPNDPENARRFKDWFRFVILDQTLYFWLLNTFTILLFIFGALCALHPIGKVPLEGTLIWDEATILEGSMGIAGRYLFLIIGLMTLMSTQIALTDGVARSLADIFTTSFAFGRKLSASTWYTVCAVAIMVIGTLLTALLQGNTFGRSDLDFLFNSAYVGGFAMAVYSPLVLWMNLRHLPKSARPRLLNIVMVSLASLFYMGFAFYCVLFELKLI